MREELKITVAGLENSTITATKRDKTVSQSSAALAKYKSATILPAEKGKDSGFHGYTTI